MRRGLLVGVSETGLAMLTERQDSPAPGARIMTGKRSRKPPWPSPAVVTRIDHLSGLLDLVAAEYVVTRSPRTAHRNEERSSAPATA